MQRNERTSFAPQRRFVSEVELEQITGISRRTWQKYRLVGRGPQYYRIYGTIRYELDEVLAWIKTFALSTPGVAPNAEVR